MSDKFKHDLSQSALIFKHVIYPIIKDWIGGGELIPVENVTEKQFTKLLDTNAGIDGWYVENNKGIRGLASRIQYRNAYNTFTIRYERHSGVKTEYEKLDHAINEDWLYPHYFIQAYVNLPKKFNYKEHDFSKNEIQILNIALTKTEDLISYYNSGKEETDWFYKEVTKHGAAIFIVIPWRYYNETNEAMIYDKSFLDKPPTTYAEKRLAKNRKKKKMLLKDTIMEDDIDKRSIYEDFYETLLKIHYPDYPEIFWERRIEHWNKHPDLKKSFDSKYEELQVKFYDA